MDNFDKWDLLYRDQNLYPFNQDKDGILWLKVRAISRRKLMSRFISENNISMHSDKNASMSRELYELLMNRTDSEKMLNSFLQGLNHELYEEMGVDKDALKEDLYKVQYYTWGGDQNNSLDKYLISHFVKTIPRFSDLKKKEGEIAINTWNYVQNSWYNNWTSFLIESLFKQNKRVISAVGEIKSVDFFIENFPIDLKVTFFPNGFMDEKLKSKLGKTKLAWLKAEARRLNIRTDSKASKAQQIYTLKEKISEHGHDEILNVLVSAERDIIMESQNDPVELMTWLYENQGEMRFGAENRIYLVLANTKSLEESWKLKRSISQLEPIVEKYLKSFTKDSLKHINFIYKNKKYSAMSDIIFFIK